MGLALSLRSQVLEVFTCLRQQGLKKTFQIHGWKFVAMVVAYYLIRDTFIYVIAPLILFKLWGGGF